MTTDDNSRHCNFAELRLRLESFSPDARFEQVLATFSEFLKENRDDDGPGRTASIDPSEFGPVVRTLAVRYASYVRSTFGTRLSPHLSRAYRPSGNNGGERSGRYRREASEQAAFLGQVVGLAVLLRNDDDSSSEGDSSAGLFTEDRPSLLISGARGKNTIPINEEAKPWAWLWIRLAVIDLVGCGPLLVHVLKHDEFGRGLKDILGPDNPENESKPNNTAAEINRVVDQLVKRYFPRNDTSADVFRLPSPPWHRSKDKKAERNPLRVWLEQLTASWLFLLTTLDVRLLRHRHLFLNKEEAGPAARNTPHSDLERLWLGTRETFHAWMWIRRSGASLSSSEDTPETRIGLARQILAGRRSEDKDGHFVLGIDSLWLQSYLLEAVARHMSLREIASEHFPDRFLTVSFLKSFAELAIHVLWSTLRTEADGPIPGLPAIPRDKSSGTKKPVESDSGTPENSPADVLVFGRGVAPIGIEAYTMALIRNVDIYAHHVIGLPFEIHVGRYLRWFLDAQGPLYLVHQRYRDHVYHVIDVFLLGDFLLGCRLGRQRSYVRDVLETLLERGGGKSGASGVPPVSPVADLRKNWCVAGLFHDLGYPALLQRKAIGLGSSAAAGQDQFDALVGESLRTFVEEMRQAFLGGSRKLEQRIREAFTELDNGAGALSSDHGVLSAIMIQDFMKQIQWADSERRLVEEFSPALTAIYLHNLFDRLVRIENAPLTYLLAFCDEIQDWGRRRVAPEGLSRELTWAVSDPLNWQLRSIPVLPELRLEVDGFLGHDVVLPGSPGETVPQREGEDRNPMDEVVIDLYQVYNPVGRDILDPLFLWISKARNLERLNAREAPWRSRLFLLTAVPDGFRRMEMTFLELLSLVADRCEELNLFRFVHHLVRGRKSILKEVDEKEASQYTNQNTDPHTSQNIGAESLRSLDPKEWDWVVLDQRKLAEDPPLRSFGTTAGFGKLAEVEGEVIRELMERYRYQGRGIWHLAAAGEGKDGNA